MKKAQISFDNGNSFAAVDDLTDDQVRRVLEVMDAETHDAHDEDVERYQAASESADGAANDREWLDRYIGAMYDDAKYIIG